MYTTYVLYSRSFNKIYIGFSSNVESRLNSHNDVRNTGWTKKYQPWEIVYHENFQTKSAAMRREKELKSSRGRAFVWGEVIKKDH